MNLLDVTRSGIIVAAIVFSANTAVAQQSSCNKILELGFKNIKKKYGERASLVYKYKSYCGKDYKDWKDEQVIGASIDVIGSGSGTANYSRAQAETVLKTWCDNSKDLATYTGVDIEESEDVNRDSVNAWSSCQRLFGQGVIIDALPTDDVVDLKVRYTGPIAGGVEFYEVKAQNFKCDTKFPTSSGNSAIKRITTETISVYCTRSPERETPAKPKGEQFKKRDRASITVRTAAPEPYTLSFVEEWVPDVPIIESRKLQALVVKQEDALKAIDQRLTSQLQGLSASVAANNASANTRLQGAEIVRSNLQQGRFDVGPAGGEARVRVNFPTPYGAVPTVVATLRSNGNDFIVVTTTGVDQNGFDAWIKRINGGAWAAVQTIQWIAYMQ